MNKATELFKKIYVDNVEIDLDILDSNNGKFQVGQQNQNVNVKFILKNGVTAIPVKLFAETDMTDITLPEVITSVAADAFEGLTLPAETIAALKEKLPEGENLINVTEKTEQQEDPQPQTYTVKFMNGEDTVYTITDVTGTEVVKPSDPEKEGYTFIGWSIDSENAVEEVISTIGNNNITYIALWQEIVQPQTEYYFYVGTTKPSSIEDAEVVSEYLEEQTYTNNSGAKSHIFVLTNIDKNVTFINIATNNPVTQVDVDTTTISGYNIFETSVGTANTGSIKIRIS